MTVSKSITVEFSGGMEMLFNDQRSIDVTLPDKIVKMKDLLPYLRDTYMVAKDASTQLFMLKDTVRPGVLVLVNDVDWELLDTTDYEIADNDTILFISTLHGG
ncbi:hypothetical protein MIR68_007795 [Amoeboaphelidium protococcarum]|nr:hypothetical protein MIR68_009427 [Amoeboaphelidium protococcarum]KAI3634191.1 hypothetical protein MIR68_007795 [Amoeboaphelidium protococcarum]KAI3645376.1 hypothetical protein MP228_008304 [Amoeboaphelidium protococcarum]